MQLADLFVWNVWTKEQRYEIVILVFNKKLSCCKQIARQLCTQFVEGISSNSVTLKSRLVTQGH